MNKQYIKLESFETNRYEFLMLEIKYPDIEIYINDKQIISINLNEFDNLMHDYNQINLIADLPPAKRKIFQIANYQYNYSTEANMFRFILSSYYNFKLNLLAESTQNITNNFLKNMFKFHKIDAADFLYDNIIIEKTGSIGPQPTAYLIPEHLTNSRKSLHSLMKKGLINRIIYRMYGAKKISYYLPFDKKNQKISTLGIDTFIWFNIRKSFQKSIERFTK